MRDVEIVFFDAGHTLLYTDPPVGTVYAEAGRRYGVDVAPEIVEDVFRRAFLEKKLDGRPQDRAWWRDIVIHTFARLGDATDPEALFDDLYAHFHDPAAWPSDPHGSASYVPPGTGFMLVSPNSKPPLGAINV